MLVEDRRKPNQWIIPGTERYHTRNHAALRRAYKTLQAEGIQNLYYIEGDHLYGTDTEGSTDGSHANDLGFMRQANLFEPVLRQAIGEPAVTLPREQRLADYLTNKKFVGSFTIDGQDDPPKTEEYLISKCEKIAGENLYRLTARIRYGDTDKEVPLDLKILFAGETPVITLDGFWIPGMGTFDARVLIRKDHYAGTWQHGEHGGHMMGQIQDAKE